MNKILEAVYSENPEKINKQIERIQNLLDFLCILLESQYRNYPDDGRVIKKDCYCLIHKLISNRAIVYVDRIRVEYIGREIDNICYKGYIYVIGEDLLHRRCVAKRKIIEED